MSPPPGNLPPAPTGSTPDLEPLVEAAPEPERPAEGVAESQPGPDASEAEPQPKLQTPAYGAAAKPYSLGGGVAVGLLLVAISQFFGMEYLVSEPTTATAWALSWGLWLFGCCFSFIALFAIVVYASGVHEKYLVRVINSALYSVDENGTLTGTLSSPLTVKNIEIALLRCRISLLSLKVNPKLLDDALFDPFLNWSPLRTRKIELDKVEIGWSLFRAPRLTFVLGGLHIGTFGQWNDDACLVRSFRLARTGLWGWVDNVYNHDRDRVVCPMDASDKPPTRGQAPGVALRSFCNKTGRVLKTGGQGDDRWFHKRATAVDICGQAYDSLSASEQEHYVEVEDAASLGEEANSFAYRVVGARQFHTECSAPQSETKATASSASWLVEYVSTTLQLELNDFRFSYTQASVQDCPLGMNSDYVPEYQRSSANTSDRPNCELHGFLIRVGKLALGPNVVHTLGDQASEWERTWNQLAPRGETHFQPSPERSRFEEWELESFKEPCSDQNMEYLSRVGKQCGVLENFSFHLLGGAPNDDSHVPAQAAYIPHVERATGPFYDDEMEDRNTRAPLVLLSSEFEFYRTGTGISPVGEIGRIDCPTSKLRVKLSTQDAAILVPIAARFAAYKTNADAALSYGTTSLRPSLPGFARVKQELTAHERWKWACLAIQQARREERHAMSWDMLQRSCDVRKRYVGMWKRYIYLDLQLLYKTGKTPSNEGATQEQTALRNAAKELENSLEWDQCIMYRRIAWMHVMAEIEFSDSPVCTLAHGRDRMLQLVDNSNQWAFDFGYLCPHSCHCETVDYELCIAVESATDTKTFAEFEEALAANDLGHAVDFTDGTATSLTIRLQIENEARLPEVRFRVSQGEIDLRRGRTTHKIATLSAIDVGSSFASGAWLAGSPLADSGDPISCVLYLSDIHVVHDPSLGDFMGQVGASCAPFGALGARLPPLGTKMPDLGASGMPAARAPSVAGGSVEADQLANRSKQGTFVFGVDRIRIDLPMHVGAEDGIQLRLQKIGAQVGLPNVATETEWCCEEHRVFAHWPFQQLYQRSHLGVEEFAVDLKHMGQVESLLEPGKLDVILDSCLLTQQWRLPNIKADVSVSQFALKVSPSSLQAAMQCITHLQAAQQEHAASAAKQVQLAAEQATLADPQPQDAEAASSDTESEDDEEYNSRQKNEQIMHPTCFCLLELFNFTQYVIKLEHWTSKTGQILSEISQIVQPTSRIQWASAQRGKLKGNEGCAVFSIHNETDNIHAEILLLWSIPWVGENTAAVAIGKPGEFTFMAEMTAAKQRRELIKLIGHYTNNLHKVNAAQRAQLGDIQVTSSFGLAPCKFGIFDQRRPESIHGLLHLPDDPRTLKRRRRHITCSLKNNTKHYLQLETLAFGLMDGQCVKAIDPIIPPDHLSVWSSAATRVLRGNVGCAIFSVGGVAELLVQWYVPNVGSRLVECVLARSGTFSSISDSKLQQQLEEGPEVKRNMNGFSNFQGLRVTHEMVDKKTAYITLSAFDEEIRNSEPAVELLSIDDVHSEGVKLWNYQRLALTCSIENISASVVREGSVRTVSFKLDDIRFHMQQSDLQSRAHVGVGALEVVDTFYSGEDMYLITSHAYGSVDNFVSASFRMDTHPSLDYAHHGTLSTKVVLQTSPVKANYTFNTIFFLLALQSDAIQQRSPPAEPAQPRNVEEIRSSNVEDAGGNVMKPMLKIEIHTGEVSISICNSKLTPLVQLMLNKTYVTYDMCGQYAHGVCHIDFGVFYHNMELSAWEPVVEWVAAQLDLQMNEKKSTAVAVSDQPLNINITSELIVSLMWIQADMAAFYDDDDTNDPSEDCPLYVVNQSGLRLDFNIMNEHSRKADDVRRQHLLNLWATVDSDNSGTLDRNEVRQVMTKMGKHLSVRDLDAAMAEIDTDGSGEVDFPEFFDWFQTLGGKVSPGARAGGWTPAATSGEAVGVPRDRVHMESPPSFDPAALGTRGELSTNFILFRLGAPDSEDRPGSARTEWRPLKPQSLSSTGTSIHYLRSTMTSTGQCQQKRPKHGPERAFVCVTVAHRNSATYITLQSPIMVSNQLPVDLLMELVDDANFESQDFALPSQTSVPIPVHLVGQRVRFKHIDNTLQLNDQRQSPSRWTDFMRPGDSTYEDIVLSTPRSCCAYPVFMDKSRGPDTGTVVLHCPLKFENTLPCAVKITLTKQGAGKSASPRNRSLGMCAAPRDDEAFDNSNSKSVSYQQFVLQKGETFVPSGVDVRFGMTIFVELQGTAANQLSKLNQKAPAIVWPLQNADTKVKFLDTSKRKLKLQLAYESQQGKPTTVTLYATHWVVNETQLELQYFVVSKGHAHEPANHEGRQWSTPEPFLWCFPNGESANNKLGFGLSGKPEGTFVAPNHPELCTTLQIKSPRAKSKEKQIGRTKHRIVCYVKNGPGRFMRTKIVHLRHELVFRNQTTHAVALRCVEGDCFPVRVLQGETCPFSWPENDTLYKALILHYDREDLYSTNPSLPEDPLQWSAEFEIGSQNSDGFIAHIGELFLKVPHAKHSHEFTSLRIAVTHDTTTRQNVVIITEQEAPYIIENHLNVKVGYRQLGTAHLDADHNNWQELKPKHFAPFNWDVPLSKSLAETPQLLEILVNAETVVFDINAVGVSSEDTSSAGCVGEVFVEGHARVLKLYERVEDLPSRATIHRADQLNNYIIEVRLHSFGVSVVDNTNASPKELMYLLVDGIYVHLGSSSTQSTTEVQIADIQIADQTTSNALKEVVFGRHHSAISSGARVDSDTIIGIRDHFHLSIVSDLENSSDSCDVYSFVALGVRPSVVLVDDNFIVKLWKYQQQISDKLAETFPQVYGPDADIPIAATIDAQGELLPPDSHQEDISALRRVYFRRLEIHPVMLEVTVNIDGILFDGDGLGLPGFIQSLGVAFGNVSGAQMSLSELIEDNVFETAEHFTDHVMSFYSGQLVVAGFRVLGASSFLGNPVALLGNISGGVGDFFYMPARGLVVSPTEFVKGLSKGTESLVLHTLTGVLLSLGTATGAVGKGLDKLSDSASHAARLEAVRAKHGTGIVAGLTVGTETLAFGLMDGMSGIALQPLHGLKTNGLPGLLQGLERGLVGSVAQPAAGVLSLVSEVVTGCSQTKILGYSVGDELKRARMPRPFFHGRLLTPFSQEWAAIGHTAPKPATLKITLHGVIFPEVASGASLWSGKLRAAIAIGPSGAGRLPDTLAEGVDDVCVDLETGLAVWNKNRTGQHQFADISVELEDHALPPAFEVLSITILSVKADRAEHAKLEPLVQFDVLLSGLGLDDAWKTEARYERAANMAGATKMPEITRISDSLCVRSAFERMDKHGDGQINRAELIAALKTDETLRAILQLPAQVGENERRLLEERFQELDSDHSRHFGWGDFQQYVQAHRSFVQQLAPDDSHNSRSRTHAQHKQVRVRKAASWERDDLHHVALRTAHHSLNVRGSIHSAPSLPPLLRSQASFLLQIFVACCGDRQMALIRRHGLHQLASAMATAARLPARSTRALRRRSVLRGFDLKLVKVAGWMSGFNSLMKTASSNMRETCGRVARRIDTRQIQNGSQTEWNSIADSPCLRLIVPRKLHKRHQEEDGSELEREVLRLAAYALGRCADADRSIDMQFMHGCYGVAIIIF